MNVKQKEIRDHKYHNKLACIYDPENGVIEIKLFRCRILRIRFPTGTPIEFKFDDSKSIA